MRRVVFAVPGSLDTPTGGYAYDKRMVAELRALGWSVEVVDLGVGFPKPADDVRQRAATTLESLPSEVPVVVDGLAYGVLPDVAERMRESHRLIALVHHPLALESGVTPEEGISLRASERAALACARTVIANSPATARELVANYGVEAGNITIAPPGTDRPASIPVWEPKDHVALLTVAAVVPRKGYDVLIAALAELGDAPWRLTIVGDCSRDSATTARLKADIARFGLADRVTIMDAVPAQELAAHYAAADVFVLPSRYEGFGMAYAEAIAHGLPVMGTTAGAIPDTVPLTAGILVPPDDVAALAAALRRLVADPAERRRLADGAVAAAAALPTWEGSAKLFAAAIERAA